MDIIKYAEEKLSEIRKAQAIKAIQNGDITVSEVVDQFDKDEIMDCIEFVDIDAYHTKYWPWD